MLQILQIRFLVYYGTTHYKHGFRFRLRYTNLYLTQENLVLWLKVTSSAGFTLELEELSFYSGQLLLKCLYCLPVLFLQVPDLISEIVPESFILGCQLTQSLGMLCFHDHVIRLYCAEPENSIYTNHRKWTAKDCHFYISKFFRV